MKIDMSGVAMVLTLSLAIRYGHAVRDVAENVQKAVTSAVEAMTGCPVEQVHVHVSGICMKS